MDKEKRQAQGVESASARFKAGGYAISHHYISEGKIVKIEDAYDNACWVEDGMMLPIDELEPISAKDAFLTELKALMEKYDAEIQPFSDGWDGEVGLLISIGDDGFCYDYEWFRKRSDGMTQTVVTAQNLMDYEKD